MKTKFKIKLDTEFEIDLSDWSFSDREKSKENDFKHSILTAYFYDIGFDEAELTVIEKKETSLFEVMGEMFKPK